MIQTWRKFRLELVESATKTITKMKQQTTRKNTGLQARSHVLWPLLGLLLRLLRMMMTMTSRWWRQPTVDVDLINHILEFTLGRVLTQWPHDRAELRRADCAVAVLVEQTERLAELCHAIYGLLQWPSSIYCLSHTDAYTCIHRHTETDRQIRREIKTGSEVGADPDTVHGDDGFWR